MHHIICRGTCLTPDNYIHQWSSVAQWVNELDLNLSAVKII